MSFNRCGAPGEVRGSYPLKVSSIVDPFAYIREAYQVPAYKGRLFRFKEMIGIIVEAQGAYVVIKLDGYPLTLFTVHFNWKMEYMEEGEK
jgi:hypothetical protein